MTKENKNDMITIIRGYEKALKFKNDEASFEILNQDFPNLFKEEDKDEIIALIKQELN